MLKQLRVSVALAAVLLAAPLARAATEWKVDPAHSSVQFKVRHLVVSTVVGSFKEFAGTIDFDPAKPAAAKIVATAKTASVDTGNADRDAHLKKPDFFDAAKFPEIKFESTKVTAKGANEFTMDGNLTMHGVTKPVSFAVTHAGVGKSPQGNDVAGFEATGKLSRKEFGMTYGKVLETGGLAIGDEITMIINVEATKPGAAKK